MDEAQKLMHQATEAKKRSLTPEQRRRKQWVDWRASEIQRVVKAPKSGTFGGKRKDTV